MALTRRQTLAGFGALGVAGLAPDGEGSARGPAGPAAPG